MIVPSALQTREDVAAHYDELDRIYRDIWGDHVHHGYWRTGNESTQEATEALVELVAEKLRLSSGQRLCDIGCGYGATAEHLAHRHGVEVTGLTVSVEQFRVASQRRAPLRFILRDWLSNGLPDQAFDRACAIESLAHMPDKQRFFDEASRTLRPGGRLVVCAWLASADASRFEVRHLLEPICREGRLPGMGNRAEYSRMAANAGFIEQDFEDIGTQVRKTWSICAARLLRRFLTNYSYRRMLLDREVRNRRFLLSIARIMAAYRTGAMGYGVFTFERT